VAVKGLLMLLIVDHQLYYIIVYRQVNDRRIIDRKVNSIDTIYSIDSLEHANTNENTINSIGAK
jgi:hypothetical protein